MTLRRVLCALALLLSAAVWAGGWTDHNPTTLRPHLVTGPLRAVRPAPDPVRGRQAPPTTPPTTPSVPRVLALRGVTVDGDWIDLPVPAGLRLSDALPMPSEPLADLEIDGSDGLTRTVAIEDPDAAAEAGAVWIDEAGDLAIAAP